MVSGSCSYCGRSTSEIVMKRNIFCSYKHLLLFNPGSKLKSGIVLILIGLMIYFNILVIFQYNQTISLIFSTTGIIITIFALIGFLVKPPEFPPDTLDNPVEINNPRYETLADHYVIQPGMITQRISQLLVFGWFVVDIFFSIFIGRLIIAATLIGILLFPLVGRNFTNKILVHPNHFILKGTFTTRGYYYKTLGKYISARIKYNALGKPAYVISAEFVNENNQLNKILLSSVLPVQDVLRFLETYNHRYHETKEQDSDSNNSPNSRSINQKEINYLELNRTCKACGKVDNIGKNYCPNCGSNFS